LLLKSAMLKWTKTEKLVKSGSRRASKIKVILADTIFGHPINLNQVPTIMLTISSNHSHKSLNCPWNFTIRSIVRNSYKRVCNLPLIYNQPTLPIVGLIMGSWLGFIGCPNIVSATVLALALIPTENQIFMACLDAHLYEIEYTYTYTPIFFKSIVKVLSCWYKPLVI
jgi:hypothetical protein